ncbi:hypothetical protein ABVD19_22680 [Xanthomonas euvesicatoria]|uniref:hypothetical protein n=1 Tax=Xanthomonas euvesicatoria TaxID=456327 RepID=UPI0013E01AE0|nr:hypothetical protein [Xanthomonas euvesicatoria]MCC8503252.1 hypothetical protein [Xanthomonas euvesicatoria pv. euvesicatoria]MCC8517752.1 hypothetical protein [Xanthomonas euvesicatoria pv. euvesicatoria]MCC8571245.1 hypothetical protein [Xanthomonas euvesicatoria pv. euvesicatoria]MCC8575623.1 hypothetical protein [Xanthomonas euvesicatoria pv. euvesicatoria]MCC8579462.1 hypothetical protein [Xanthomonas euvesicatoria pv. euvesicatoria]
MSIALSLSSVVGRRPPSAPDLAKDMALRLSPVFKFLPLLTPLRQDPSEREAAENFYGIEKNRRRGLLMSQDAIQLFQRLGKHDV